MLVLMVVGLMRFFIVSDVSMLQEDFKSMKDFFIVDGDGLFVMQVEREVVFVIEVVFLFLFLIFEVIQRFNFVYGIGKGGIKLFLFFIMGIWSVFDLDILL